ncbi:MAG: hypothetical protein ACOCYU_05215 [Brevefilum sp.]
MPYSENPADTHDLSDIAKLCERVIIIDLRKIMFDGKLSDLMGKLGGRRLPKFELTEETPKYRIRDLSVEDQPIEDTV